MFEEFSHRQVQCLVDGISEKVVLSRDNKSSSVISREYLYNGLFAPLSAVQTGSMVESDEGHFIVQTMRRTTEKDRYCSLLKTNAVIDLQQYGQTFDAHDNPIGVSFTTVQSGVKVFAQYVTARLRQEEIGLLQTTTHVLILQTSTNIREPEQAGYPDRVIMGSRPYQVDSVDTIKYPNLLYVQLSEDRR